MTDLSSVKGATGQPYVIPVEQGKVREFARATRARRLEYVLDNRSTIPPTWLVTSSFWTEPENLALGHGVVNWSRTLHGGYEFVFHGSPPRAGDVLSAQQHIADVYAKEGRRGGAMTFTVLVTEYRNESGRLVAEARSTLIETSKAAQ